ncbi:Ferric hydroxamate ABC transporter [Marinobacterium lacunae]|uniref:Ferric hydroxamate ABC transporter n=1 Tax=Marinobacterium lacunae TaxID=1232683 RepID=A0A081FVT1_9GAMM|nr:ABC transporter ATP-binding protein [Marinobacterium lacunae]KEA62636.1 Ferric hydroxamate ABC transporter [Marinobacterium lacunae]
MIEISNICIEHEGRSILSIDQLTLNTNEVTVILGHNGSGKSTLMHLLARQRKLQKGSIRLKGRELKALPAKHFAREVAFMPQQLPSTSGLNVRELVMLGRYPWRGLIRRWTDEDQQCVEDAMQHTDIDSFANTPLESLSGGERQRAWIAMLLAQSSPLLLLDEPTSALDLSHQYELMQRLKHLNRNLGRGVIVILHDLNLALRYADKIVALHSGQVCFSGTPKALLCEQRLSKLYNIPIQLIDQPGQATPVAIVA